MRRFPTRAEILDLIPRMDALITERAGVIDREIINAGAKLKLIQRIGSLHYDIDLAAAREHNVTVAVRPFAASSPSPSRC